MERGEYYNAQPFEGQRTRPKRPVTDYGSTVVQWIRDRQPRYEGAPLLELERPSASYIADLQPPAARVSSASETIPAKSLHSSLNKIKHPINVVLWTPEGRRLLTGSTSGEFTLWNGMGFNFETIMQAHEAVIRDAKYSYSQDWLISSDQSGVVKYWQPNFNNVKEIQAHQECVRGLAFAPTDSKFVTCADDATLKIWDFAGGTEESTLTGHGWEVKAVDWHPTKGLLVSGSKDHQVKLWDPRTGRALTTLHGHKQPITRTVFERTQGDLLATCAKDPVTRIFDLRMMRDVLLLRGYEKEIHAVTWHPQHRNLVSTGGTDGAHGTLNHYLLDEQNAPAGAATTLSPYDSHDPSNAAAQTIYPAHSIPFAHDNTIWTLDWHPLGHLLASGSGDRVTRFWTRARPGDNVCFKDRYHVGQAAAEAQGTYDRRDGRRQMREEEEQEAEDEADALEDQKMPSKNSGIPSLPGITADGTSTGGAQLPGIGGAAPVPAPPFPPVPVPGAVPGVPPPPGALPPGMDFSKLAEMFGSGQFPPPIPAPNGTPNSFPPPPPGFGFPAGMPPPPPGFPGFPPPPPNAAPGFPPAVPAQQNGASNDAGGVRKRAPLPSQKESLQAEMKRGKFNRGGR